MKKFLILLILLIISSCNCPTVHTDPFMEDAHIQSQLLEVYGYRLDQCYNPSKDIEERGNWVLDVGSEMDWEDLIPLIIAMPDFGSDSDYEELYKIIHVK